MSETNLIVDGAITADKLTANHLNAVNTESGTFQQSYTAPGDDNTTPGAGLKITGGNIEAYGLTHSFGGTIISSDGAFMISIGKFLTATGQTKKYPINNATNFTPLSGCLVGYAWVGSAWVERFRLGNATGGSVMYIFDNGGSGYASLDVESTTHHALSAHTTATDYAGVSGYGDADAYGGVFTGGKGPIILAASASASAPSHNAVKGTLWVTSAGVLYINTDGGTTWAKVGAQ